MQCHNDLEKKIKKFSLSKISDSILNYVMKVGLAHFNARKILEMFGKCSLL